MNEMNQVPPPIKSNSKTDLSKTKNLTTKPLTDSYSVVKFESLTERERKKLKTIGDRSPTKMPTQLIHPADDDDSGC